jgi:hypothetical protein
MSSGFTFAVPEAFSQRRRVKWSLVGLYPGACFSSQEMNVLEGIFWFHAR